MVVVSHVLALVAFFVGFGGALAFFGLVSRTGNAASPRDATEGSLPWVVDVALLLLFALQHSGMARESVKNLLARLIPGRLVRSTYVATSGLALFALADYWEPLPGEPLWRGPLWICAISLLGWFAVGVCALCFEFASFFGFTQAATGVLNVSGPLQTKGLYRYIRHPLMLSLLIALWAQPMMPRELLLLNLGMTIYILIAIRLEERDLVREFGEDYEKYRRAVPMLIPWRVFV